MIKDEDATRKEAKLCIFIFLAVVILLIGSKIFSFVHKNQVAKKKAQETIQMQTKNKKELLNQNNLKYNSKTFKIPSAKIELEELFQTKADSDGVYALEDEGVAYLYGNDTIHGICFVESKTAKFGKVTYSMDKDKVRKLLGKSYTTDGVIDVYQDKNVTVTINYANNKVYKLTMLTESKE